MWRLLALLLTPLLCGWGNTTSTTGQPKTQYYLANAGSGGNNGNTGTSRGDPWETIAYFETNATTAPNDEVYFNRGDTWAEQLDIQQSGAAGNPITFTAYGTGAAPIITGSDLRPRCIYGDTKDYITVRGFDITGWINTGIAVADGSYWTIDNNEIDVGGNDAPPDHNIWVSSSAAAALRLGIVIDSNTIGTNQTGELGAIGNAAVLVSGVDGALISDNSINSTNTVGLWVTLNSGSADNTDVVIEGNDVYGNYGNIAVNNSDNTIIRYNTIRDGKGSGVGIFGDSDNTEIYYNLIYDLDTKSASWNGFDITDDSDSGTIYNNTVYEVYRHSLMIDDGAGAVPSSWIVKNNIFDASNNTAANEGDPQPRALAIGIRNTPITITSDYNILTDGAPVGDVASHGVDAGTLYTFLGWQGLGYGTNSDDSDPLFTNAGAENFTLQAGSPARDNGDSVGLDRDILGNPIVGTPDMGAYEYQP